MNHLHFYGNHIRKTMINSAGNQYNLEHADIFKNNKFKKKKKPIALYGHRVQILIKI